MAAYTMDSHNVQRIVVEKNAVKMVKNEGDVQVGGFPPYPISYRSLVPKQAECKNLLVPVCLSASHIAYGSIRMEPVFMVMGQSAAVAAVLAIDKKTSVQDVDVKHVQKILKSNPLADGSPADILIDNEDKNNIATQGNWKKKDSKNSYASSWLEMNGNDNQAGLVKFIPVIPVNRKYKVYTYVPKIAGTSSIVTINIFNGNKINEIVLDLNNVKVEGQTSGEWALIGSYDLKKGNKNYISLTNKNANGTVIADAVLLVAE